MALIIGVLSILEDFKGFRWTKAISRRRIPRAEYLVPSGMESSSIPVEVRSEVSQRSRKARWNDFSEFLARRRRPKRVRVLKRRNAIRSVQLSEPLRQRGTSWNGPRREPYLFWDKRSAGYFPRRTCRFWESSKGRLTFLGLTIFFELPLRKLSTRSCRFSLKSLVEFLYSCETCKMTVFMSYEMNIRLIRCYIRLSQVRRSRSKLSKNKLRDDRISNFSSKIKNVYKRHHLFEIFSLRSLLSMCFPNGS